MLSQVFYCHYLGRLFCPNAELSASLGGSASSVVFYCHFLWSLYIIPGVLFQLTEVALCHFIFSKTASWFGSSSSQVFHCHSKHGLRLSLVSLGCSLTLPHIVLCDALLLTGIFPCCPRCFTDTHFSGFLWHRLFIGTHRVAFHHLTFSLLLTKVDSCHSRFSVAAHEEGFVLSLIFYHHSLGCFCIFSCVLFPLSVVVLCFLRNTTELTEIVQHCHKSPTAAQWCNSTLSHVLHCSSLVWLCVFSSVPLLLTVVVLFHFRCPAPTYWGGSVSFQVYHCYLFGGLCIVSRVPLPITNMVPCHARYPTAIHWGVSASFQASYCCLLEWLSVILCISLLLTDAACCFRCCTAVPGVGVCVISGIHSTATLWCEFE